MKQKKPTKLKVVNSAAKLPRDFMLLKSIKGMPKTNYIAANQFRLSEDKILFHSDIKNEFIYLDYVTVKEYQALNSKEMDYKKFVLEHFEPIPQPGLVYKAKIHTIIDINGKKYRISAEDPPTLQYMYGESKT